MQKSNANANLYLPSPPIFMIEEIKRNKEAHKTKRRNVEPILSSYFDVPSSHLLAATIRMMIIKAVIIATNINCGTFLSFDFIIFN